MMIQSLFLVLCSLATVTSTRVIHRFLPAGPVTDPKCDSKSVAELFESDQYVSFFKPCKITFYARPSNTNSTRRRDLLLGLDPEDALPTDLLNLTSGSGLSDVGETCDQLINGLDIIEVTERKVFLLPDLCVSKRDVCFKGDTLDALVVSSLYYNTTYELKIPEDTIVASVNCEDDHESLVGFMDILESLKAIFHWGQALLIAFAICLLCILLGIVMMFTGMICRCICYILCCGCFRSKPEQVHQYTPIPSAPIAAKIV